MPRDMLDEAPIAPVDLNKIDTLHELLALALSDFEKVLMDDRYVPDLNIYYSPQSDGCHVCLAGAVIVGTLGLLGDEAMSMAIVNGPFRGKLMALDALRLGDIASAYRHLHPSTGGLPYAVGRLAEKWLCSMGRESYAIGRDRARAFVPFMRLLQADLAEAGL